MSNILWLSPNFNHYKARFLNRFAMEKFINLDILAGVGNKALGHQETEGSWSFTLFRIPVSKKRFGFSFQVFFFLLKNFRNYQWIMIPREKKNIFLIIFSFFLRDIIFRNSQTKLFSYNHPFFGNRYNEGFEKYLLLFLYRWYDKIIFYTEKSKDNAIEKNLIAKDKAGWANNTLDSEEIKKHYEFTYPDFENPILLFIGRLVESKRVDTFISYYTFLKERFPTVYKSLSVEIVGDGPLKKLVIEHSSMDNNIFYHGAINNEKKLSRIFKRSSVVFVPGLSGLSINHAFLYGRPFVTIESPEHGPEIDYLKSGINGYILSGDVEEDAHLLHMLIRDKKKLKTMCDNAYQTGKCLSVDLWCKQILVSLHIKNKIKDQE